MTAALSADPVCRKKHTRFLRHRDIAISNTTTIRRPLVLQTAATNSQRLCTIICRLCGLSSNGV